MQTAVFFLPRRVSHHTQMLRICLLFYLANCRASTTFAVETIIQVVCGANGRLFPTRRDSHHTQPLRSLLFYLASCHASTTFAK